MQAFRVLLSTLLFVDAKKMLTDDSSATQAHDALAYLWSSCTEHFREILDTTQRCLIVASLNEAPSEVYRRTQQLIACRQSLLVKTMLECVKFIQDLKYRVAVDVPGQSFTIAGSFALYLFALIKMESGAGFVPKDIDIFCESQAVYDSVVRHLSAIRVPASKRTFRADGQASTTRPVERRTAVACAYAVAARSVPSLSFSARHPPFAALLRTVACLRCSVPLLAPSASLSTSGCMRRGRSVFSRSWTV